MTAHITSTSPVTVSAVHCATAVASAFGGPCNTPTAERLAAGVKVLEDKGVKAAAFPTDLSDPAAARAMVGKVREALAICRKGVRNVLAHLLKMEAEGKVLREGELWRAA